MAQQQHPPQQAQGGALTLYGESAMAQFKAPDAAALVRQYLEGSDLTVERLLGDLGTMMTVNPEIAKCSKQSLFNCLVTAARWKMTFGDGGMWIIARQGQATPQPSARGLVAAARKWGVIKIEPVLVYEGEELVPTMKGGMIVDVLYKPNLLGDRSDAAVVGGLGIAFMDDGTLRYSWYPRLDLDRRLSHTSAGSSPMHRIDRQKAYERSIRAAVAREIVTDFTRGAGQLGSFVPIGSEDEDDAPPVETDADEKEPVPFSTRSQQAGADLDNLADANTNQKLQGYTNEDLQQLKDLWAGAEDKKMWWDEHRAAIRGTATREQWSELVEYGTVLAAPPRIAEKAPAEAMEDDLFKGWQEELSECTTWPTYKEFCRKWAAPEVMASAEQIKVLAAAAEKVEGLLDQQQALPGTGG